MTKNAIVTIAIGDFHQRMAELTHPSLRQYAEKIGADFIVIDKTEISKTTPHWEKFRILDLLNIYDRILYLDSDILIRKNCPDLFGIVPETSLGAFNESPFTPHRDYAIQICAREYEMEDFQWNGKYYNTGVMVLSRYHRMLFRRPKKEF